MLQVQQVSKWFDQRRSVDGIDFEMKRGEIVGFLGPNGAGKTTTMRMITGYLTPSSGQIWVDGLPMHEQSRQARSKIGYLPETPPLYPDMTVRSYLRFVADLRDVSVREQKLRISEMIDRLGLQGRERQVIRSLSKGYKQRLGLAGAIIHQPELLILDEPTSGLDPNQIMEIRQLIRELGEQHTVLLSTHILPEVSMLCNRMLIIHEGKLVLDRDADHIGDSLQQNFQVQLEVKSKPAIVRSVLEHAAFAHTEFQYSHMNEQQEQLITIKLTGIDEEDFRESLSLLLAEARIPVLEMRKEGQSLEELFAKLTTDSPSDLNVNSTSVDDLDTPLPKEDTIK
ncbi:ABC-2 type transport system ATP-binding protein [Paenibacillus sp. SORGH_AS306]|uniref:ABC transporter ATP-binding protein n=1 Tax=unclassified Paenibacillus TaxID=185978 RepID=UPI002787B982|nr:MULTISPECIES: ATP-binding cassette domain-containing protein [unclassified Paenibacillus]MDQ1235439.1 ABC-2 type transport system ATP-binding protein [Paenibacillus sp. SORGH_AS_0306]MDR6112488.1 ABC-2 type transport system ATP-binding protein [Paenibacillus sp. SORGH_AS_0338]